MPKPVALTLFTILLTTAPALADLLPDDSKWAGMQLRDKTHARSKDERCRLNVAKRDGEKFAAEFWNEGAGLRIEGTVSDKGVIRCVPTEVLKGDWQANILKDVWTGQVAEDSLTLLRPRTGKGGSFKIELKPDDNDGKKKRKKK